MKGLKLRRDIERYVTFSEEVDSKENHPCERFFGQCFNRCAGELMVYATSSAII